MDPITLGTVAGAAVALAGISRGWLRARGRLVQTERTLDRVRHDLASARWAADHDPLTALLNRRGLAAEVEQQLRPLPGYAALLILDLDGFKAVNDTLGHAAGDALLVTVARRLRGFAAGLPAARLGGDEFAVLISGPYPVPVAAATWPHPLGVRLAELLAAPMLIGGRTLRVGASIGIASVAEPAPLGVLLARADAALYRAKESGGGVAVYSPREDAGRVGRSRLSRAGRAAHPAPLA
ncbi:GGDEF domain-containing protein [Longispora sp. NPDC051575]|uniref:GGDEF domain-containing protein n=1 Tax=Longispora sp. NPDC051575 TaxID=3154943 RepID=UPI0034335757